MSTTPATRRSWIIRSTVSTRKLSSRSRTASPYSISRNRSPATRNVTPGPVGSDTIATASRIVPVGGPKVSAARGRVRRRVRVNAHQPRANAVVEHLRREILTGNLKPGDRIRQEAIAQAMGTSRIPVREALSRLQNEGLVTLTSHVGARVAELDVAELDEVYQIRERLEPLAIAESAPRLTTAQLQGLADYVEEMEACARRQRPFGVGRPRPPLPPCLLRGLPDAAAARHDRRPVERHAAVPACLHAAAGAVRARPPGASVDPRSARAARRAERRAARA